MQTSTLLACFNERGKVRRSTMTTKKRKERSSDSGPKYRRTSGSENRKKAGRLYRYPCSVVYWLQRYKEYGRGRLYYFSVIFRFRILLKLKVGSSRSGMLDDARVGARVCSRIVESPNAQQGLFSMTGLCSCLTEPAAAGWQWNLEYQTFS